MRRPRLAVAFAAGGLGARVRGWAVGRRRAPGPPSVASAIGYGDTVFVGTVGVDHRRWPVGDLRRRGGVERPRPATPSPSRRERQPPSETRRDPRLHPRTAAPYQARPALPRRCQLVWPVRDDRARAGRAGRLRLLGHPAVERRAGPVPPADRTDRPPLGADPRRRRRAGSRLPHPSSADRWVRLARAGRRPRARRRRRRCSPTVGGTAHHRRSPLIW